MCDGLNLPFSKLVRILLGYVLDNHYFCELKDINMELVKFCTIEGKRYRISRTPCTCSCHTDEGMTMHIMACCNDGWIKTKTLVE